VGDCFLSEQNAKGQDMTEVTSNSGSERSVDISHDPINCPDTSSCVYMFSVYQDQESGPVRSSLKVSHDTQDPQTISLGSEYKNKKDMGTFQYYELFVL